MNELIRKLETGGNEHFVDDYEKDNSIDEKSKVIKKTSSEQYKEQEIKREKTITQAQSSMKKKLPTTSSPAQPVARKPYTTPSKSK